MFEQCGNILFFETVEVVRAEGVRAETIVDAQKSTCRCRRYKYSLDFVGPLAGTTEEYPVEKCNRLIGELPNVYADKTTWIQTLRRDLDEAETGRR